MKPSIGNVRPELLRCPKCESTNVNASEIMTDKPFREWCAVGCEDCQFSGPDFDFDREDDGEFQAMRDAKKAWNDLPRAAPVATLSGAQAGLRAVQSLCDLLEPFLDEMNDYWQGEVQTLNPITAAYTEAEKTIANIGQCIRAIRSARATLADPAPTQRSGEVEFAIHELEIEVEAVEGSCYAALLTYIASLEGSVTSRTAEETVQQIAEALFGVGVCVGPERFASAAAIIQQASTAAWVNGFREGRKDEAASPLPPEQSDEECAERVIALGVLRNNDGVPTYDRHAAIIARHVQARTGKPVEALPRVQHLNIEFPADLPKKDRRIFADGVEEYRRAVIAALAQPASGGGE